MNQDVRSQRNAAALRVAGQQGRISGTKAMLELAKANPFFGYIDLKVPTHGEVALFSNNDDRVAMKYFWLGRYEPMSISLWAQLCASERSPIILDIGAYTGVFGLVAAKVSPSSQIVCVEPIDRIYSRIMINQFVNQLRNVKVVKGVASDAPGTARLTVSVGTGILPTGTSIRNQQPDSAIETFDVEAHTVDDLLLDHPGSRCGVMKIDAERHEVEVLQGARDCITRDTPDILIEILDEEIFSGVKELLASLHSGYRIYRVDEAGLDVHPHDDLAFTKAGGLNYLLSARDPAKVGKDIETARTAVRSVYEPLTSAI